MNNVPLVSIVTPSLNQGAYIRQTIESVISQDYSNIEYLVVDGGSTDGTLDILKEYEGRVNWVSEPDTGQSNAINKGWRRSSGQIMAWLNSDDYYYDKGAVSAVVDAFACHPEAAVVYGKVAYVDAQGHFLREGEVEPELHPSMLITNVIGQPGAFIARQALDHVGMVDESLHYVMDYELFLRLLNRYQFQYIDRYIANARIHDATKTWGQADRHRTEGIAFLKRYYSSPTTPLSSMRYRSVALANWNAALGFHWVGKAHYRHAAPYLFRAMRLDRKYARNRGVWASLFWSLIGDERARTLRCHIHGHRTLGDYTP